MQTCCIVCQRFQHVSAFERHLRLRVLGSMDTAIAQCVSVSDTCQTQTRVRHSHNTCLNVSAHSTASISWDTVSTLQKTASTRGWPRKIRSCRAVSKQNKNWEEKRDRRPKEIGDFVCIIVHNFGSGTTIHSSSSSLCYLLIFLWMTFKS